MTVSLFVTCLCDTFYPAAARAAVKVLARLGARVACPSGQTCCGQPMFNAGYLDQARAAACHFLDVFSGTDDGPIVAPSSSCAAMVRVHYPRLFEEDPRRLAQARSIGTRVFELSEFLVKELHADLSACGARFPGSVTFHRSCHFRLLGVRDEPIALIKSIPGIDYRPLERIDECCGFGGTFSLNYPHLSRDMAAEKLACVERSGAEWLVYADAGCGLNITGYARRAGRPLKAMHLAELLDRSLGGAA